MSDRTRNFYSGPAALPLEALTRARDELVDFGATGMSIMEHSHRGAAYEAVHREALSLLRELLGVPDDYHVVLLQGGARQQFAMIPMNLLHQSESADYVLTGNWAKGAFSEANLIGNVRVAANTESDGTFFRVPGPADLDLDPNAAYVHITNNNTLYGTQFHAPLETGSVPLIADMTSDLLSRPIDVSKYGLIYAAAQKNVGPAGVTVVVVKKSLVDGANTDIPEVFRYASFAAKDSLWNTPPTFAIYMMRNTLSVLKERGGAAAMQAARDQKAELVYGLIDERPDFFKCAVELSSRSRMNAVFRLPTSELEAELVKKATEAGFIGVKGHRKVGGIRISMYNWVEVDWVAELVGFLREFDESH